MIFQDAAQVTFSQWWLRGWRERSLVLLGKNGALASLKATDGHFEQPSQHEFCAYVPAGGR
jgi:hypothetical protein